MSPIQLLQSLVAIIVLGFLAIPDQAEARNLNSDQFNQPLAEANLASNSPQLAQQQAPSAANDLADLDEDNEDDSYAPANQLTPVNLPNQEQLAQAADNLYNQAMSVDPSAIYPHQQQVSGNSPDLKPAASKHYHHGHGAKGWLDMGAWTGKKGAFGWYDKHPVGKGK